MIVLFPGQAIHVIYMATARRQEATGEALQTNRMFVPYRNDLIRSCISVAAR